VVLQSRQIHGRAEPKLEAEAGAPSWQRNPAGMIKVDAGTLIFESGQDFGNGS
jgi:hypothetical protein